MIWNALLSVGFSPNIGGNKGTLLGLGMVPLLDIPPQAAATAADNAADDRAADAAWQAVYGGMSDNDLAKGWVLEPVAGEEEIK